MVWRNGARDLGTQDSEGSSMSGDEKSGVAAKYVRERLMEKKTPTNEQVQDAWEHTPWTRLH